MWRQRIFDKISTISLFIHWHHCSRSPSGALHLLYSNSNSYSRYFNGQGLDVKIQLAQFFCLLVDLLKRSSTWMKNSTEQWYAVTSALVSCLCFYTYLSGKRRDIWRWCCSGYDMRTLIEYGYEQTSIKQTLCQTCHNKHSRSSFWNFWEDVGHISWHIAGQRRQENGILWQYT